MVTADRSSRCADRTEDSLYNHGLGLGGVDYVCVSVCLLVFVCFRMPKSAAKFYRGALPCTRDTIYGAIQALEKGLLSCGPSRRTGLDATA